MKKKYNGPSQKERVQELMDVLEDGVLNFLPDPEHFKQILLMKSLMPHYTFRNILVAKAQLPNATFLAGYKRWEELGRNVIKGEKALRIFAPRFKKMKNKKTGEEETKMFGFITVPVFDVSQTEGDPLPIDNIKIELEGDCAEAREIISLAETVAENDNCPIYYDHTRGCNGFYRPFDHSITVSNKLSINHRCKTLVHELVHSKVDRLGSGREKRSKREVEIVAEGTAFIVCNYFGLDSSNYSFNYVRSYSKDEDNPLLSFGERIFNISSSIIKEFEELKNTGAMKKIVA